MSRYGKKTEFFEFTVEELRHSVEKAYLFKIEDVEEPIWVPKSQCDYDADSGVVMIADWLVKQKPELMELI